ncbi:MAG TPA: type I pantothenate kinase, partial [Acidimicrobiia bacterium]|nr:type I pantothenate kinase [Acidimicrobiia bacterium]
MVTHPRYLDFDRADWASLRGRTPLTLTEDEVEKLVGISVNLEIDMVEETFLPLSRLLNLYVQGSRLLSSVTDTFLGTQPRPTPFVIGVAGSVAVGKSTIARVLEALLARWPHHPSVDLVTTDGFLYPNAVLEERGLMEKKGFPESYDRAALIEFVALAAAGEEHLEIPVYSHIRYDIV